MPRTRSRRMTTATMLAAAIVIAPVALATSPAYAAVADSITSCTITDPAVRVNALGTASYRLVLASGTSTATSLRYWVDSTLTGGSGRAETRALDTRVSVPHSSSVAGTTVRRQYFALTDTPTLQSEGPALCTVNITYDPDVTFIQNSTQRARGTVTATVPRSSAPTTWRLTAVPNPGYIFDSWNCGAGAPIRTNTSNPATMTEITTNWVCTPIFEPGGAITEFDDGVNRRAGADRYATALAISASFAPRVPVLYVATGADFPDALSAAPAAAAQGGPLLLVPSTGPTTAILNEIRRLEPARIVVVGGEGAVSSTTYQTLRALAPSIRRDAGDDRYATSRVIVERAFSGAYDVFLATGRNFPDALSASAAAGSMRSPVLLIDGNRESVPTAVNTQLTALGAERVRLVGGTAVVSSGIESALVTRFGRSDVVRHAGADRYATSAAVNKAIFTSASTVFFAVGTAFPDALAGAALAGAMEAPLYVVPSNCVPAATLTHVRLLAPYSRVLLGGTSVLGSGVANLVACP
jgi:putative cell wall-binding protein